MAAAIHVTSCRKASKGMFLPSSAICIAATMRVRQCHHCWRCMHTAHTGSLISAVFRKQISTAIQRQRQLAPYGRTQRGPLHIVGNKPAVACPDTQRLDNFMQCDVHRTCVTLQRGSHRRHADAQSPLTVTATSKGSSQAMPSQQRMICTDRDREILVTSFGSA